MVRRCANSTRCVVIVLAQVIFCGMKVSIQLNLNMILVFRLTRNCFTVEKEIFFLNPLSMAILICRK